MLLQEVGAVQLQQKGQEAVGADTEGSGAAASIGSSNCCCQLLPEGHIKFKQKPKLKFHCEPRVKDNTKPEIN